MKIESVSSNHLSLSNKVAGQGSRDVKPNIETQQQSGSQLKEKKIDDEQLIKALEKANKSFEAFDRKFERSVHEKTNTFMVKVIDSSTGEVIRELPPEKLLDMVANMLEVAGILMDRKL
ncbi:flagellar protein FlaG [Serpentinicella alkaliphila]|uniref:Flagellar protein FlaG n=1 Tax=Serpentinicella alkaliphila TaxID=1734049 RepID=A0A4R2THV1_9FIRM|nr:flagellar protein FlaG [Serpentinicella alkaliphila]QUH24911.1 flagellar protein FlaG [Serpentinicella alkaliphila]TCQ01812.1 flagellar protein FlaG [Serpentinicella alkaliphila]